MSKKSLFGRLFKDPSSEKLATAELAEAMSRREDVSGVRTVCMVLGPYRNLTTLTASVVFLHPHVQVLNHGAGRMMPMPEVNFFDDYSPEKFDTFIRLCLVLSRGGERGRRGGSITLSHAFESPVLRDTYAARYGDNTLKDDIRSLFWKESMKVTNLIRRHGIDLADLLRRNDRLRFIFPVRNPIDCAISNRRIGYVKDFDRMADDTLEAAVDFIVEEAAWFIDQQKLFPGRFLHFFQNGMTRDTLGQIAAFLGVEPEERWIADSLKCWSLKESYAVEPATKAACIASVERHMARHPEARAALLAMVG